MFRRIALSAGVSLLAVVTIVAVSDYFRILYRPVIASEWQLHYALLVATPVEATMLAYAQAFLDYVLSPLPAVATVCMTGLLAIVQILERRARRARRLLESLPARTAIRFSGQRSRTA